MENNSAAAPASFIAKNKKYLVIIAVLIACIIAAKVIKSRMPQAPKPQAQQQAQQGAQERVPVTVYKTSRINFEDSLSLYGNVEGGEQSELNFEKDGKIGKINYKEGDFVKKGAVIASLDNRDAALKLQQARIEYEQHKKLFEAGVIIKTKLEQAEVAHQQAQVDYEKTIMRAPFDGVLSGIEHKEGEVVNPTKKIVSIFDTKKMYINIGITENDINKLAMDQAATVMFDAVKETTFKGTIVNINPHVDETVRMMTAKIAVDNNEALILPGMFARTKICVFKQDNALVLPSSALQKEEKSFKVFVVGEGNVVAPRVIDVGYLSSDYAVVTSGLNEGELVAIEKLDKMKEGVAVEVLNVEEYTTHTPGKKSE